MSLSPPKMVTKYGKISNLIEKMGFELNGLEEAGILENLEKLACK